VAQHSKVVGSVVTHPIRFVGTLKDDVATFVVTVNGRLANLLKAAVKGTSHWVRMRVSDYTMRAERLEADGERMGGGSGVWGLEGVRV
jgi:hypothetical protein